MTSRSRFFRKSLVRPLPMHAHLYAHLPSSMSQLLFILGLGQLVNAASLYQHPDFSHILSDGPKVPQAPVLPFPDLTRRLQEGPVKTTECIYKGERYLDGERVPTAQPCLNCTCNVPHVLCYLKLCPKVSAPPSGCFAAREVGECCPTLVCGGLDLSEPKEPSNLDPDLRPTFQPAQQETIATDKSLTTELNPTGTVPPVYSNQTDSTFINSISLDLHSVEDIANQTLKNILTSLPTESTTSYVDGSSTNILSIAQDDTSHAITRHPTETVKTVDSSSSPFSAVDSSPITSTETLINSPTPVLESKPTDEILTVTHSTFHTTLTDEGDSLVYITSTHDPGQDYETNRFNDIPGGCRVNGTLYGDGSAMLSSTFCEYCFCIRSKSACLKPKCHLAIPGCTPFYENHYSCCPSRYHCSQRIFVVPNSTVVLTAMSSTTLPETTVYTGHCIVDGAVYHQGDVVPNRIACHNCYCSDSNVVCEKIMCAPPLEGCQPIIPEGRCCPISYRCDYPSWNDGNNNKGNTLNISASSNNIKESNIKTIKAYFSGGNMEIRLKEIPHDGESIALLHNVIPIRRRLDEDVPLGENSTAQDSDVSPVYKGETLPENYNNSDYIEVFNSALNRDNDKTLELNDTTVSNFYSYEDKLSRNDDFQTAQIATSPEESFSTKRVSVGSPKVHTFSIEQLFNQFFTRHQGNTPNFSDSIFVEPKRNNSKQPGSLIDIPYDGGHTTDSYTLSDITTKLEEILETVEDVPIIAERIKLEPANLDVPYVKDTLHNITTEKSRDVTDSTNHIQESTVLNREQLTENNTFSLSGLPSTTATDTEEIVMRKNSKTTIPVFISTRNMEPFFQHEAIHEFPLSVLTATNQDILETNPTPQILATTSNFDSDEILVTEQSEIQSPVYTQNLHNEDSRQIGEHPTPQSYARTRNFNNVKLETDFDFQPTISIYNLAKNSYNGPNVVTGTYPTSALINSTEQFHEGDLKETEKYAGNRTISSENLEKETEIPSTYPGYITAKYSYTQDETEIHPTFPPYSSSKNVYSEKLKINALPQYSTPKLNTFNDLIIENFQKLELKSTTLTTVEDTDTGIFSKDIGTSSTFTSTRNINDDSNDGENAFVSQISHTQNVKNEEFSHADKTKKITPSFSNPKEYSVTVDDLVTELITPQDLERSENSKTSTRINSKLPSLSYIEKANEKNISVYSRFPVLTDSVVNVYLPPKDRDSERKDSTKVGSIFIGAPLSVGGSDSQPKITQSGGLIFMDPHYTDINTKGETLRDSDSKLTQLQSTSNEKMDLNTNGDRKKGPRIQDSNQTNSGQGYKIIPFVAKDAVRNQFGKINNTMVAQQGSTERVPDMVSDFCFIKGRIYMNGENIGKADPCETCRCFYGRELCQIQRCPMPSNCIPEKVPGFCCPRFTCGNNTTADATMQNIQLLEIPTSSAKLDSTENVSLSNNKQEVKFGIRVRTRPTQSVTVSKEQAAEESMESVKATINPNINPVTGTTTTTTTKKANIIRTQTNPDPEIKRTTTQNPLNLDPWGLLKVSGCNIYGKFFSINDQVEILSGPCSHCVCTTNGVECNDIC